MINIRSIADENNIKNSNHDNIKFNDFGHNIYWFLSKSKYGNLIIGLFKRKNNTDSYYSSTVLGIVKTIQREEQLLQIIEDWLDSGFYLNPTKDISSINHSVTFTLRNKTANDDSGKLILGFNESTLNLMPVPSETLKQYVNIQTSTLPTKLVLSEVSISKEQLDTIQPGNILLIRESFISPWVVKAISQIHMDKTATGLIDTDNRTFHIYNGNQQQSEEMAKNRNINHDDSYQLTVAINDLVNLPFGIFYQWINDGSHMLTTPLINYKIEIWSENTFIACGHLLSLSSGYGVFIDKV
jgi:hypothetical protein